MNKIGKFLALISPVLALGVVALMLFGLSSSYQSGSCRSSYGNQSSGPVECTYESGKTSAFRHALEDGDTALFYWSGAVVLICLVAAIGTLVGRSAPIWVCALALYVLSVLGMMSIGLFILPLAVVLFASAVLLTVARYDRASA